MVTKDYKYLIGDGKLPNLYWVFQYDERFHSESEEFEECANAEPGGCLGEFKTYREAMAAADDAYLPHVVIEDRLSGVVFETICRVCDCCGKEDWENNEDIRHTKEKLGEDFE